MDKNLRAKMEIIKELLGFSEDAMGEDLKSYLSKPQEVTVAADDEESLSEGLEVAKDMVDSDESMKDAAKEMLADHSLEMDDDNDEDEEEDDDMSIFGKSSKLSKKDRMKSKFNMLGED